LADTGPTPGTLPVTVIDTRDLEMRGGTTFVELLEYIPQLTAIPELGESQALTGGARGATQPSRQRRPPAERAQRPEPRQRFSSDPASGKGKTIIEGVLLQGTGRVLDSGLPQSRAGGTPKPAQGTPGTADEGSRIAGGMLLALGVVSMGALRERRRVRLRLA